MSIFQDLRTNTWAFLEAYGWITVFVIGLVYVIYKKYIYDLVRNWDEERKLVAQKKFDQEVHEKEGERMRLARERQQEEHDKQSRIEIQKREKREKEIARKKLEKLEEQDKTCQVLGHGSNLQKSNTSFQPGSAETDLQRATDIVDSVPRSAYITIFGNSACPDFRKVCQLVSTYRLDASQFRIFEFDKQSNWPSQTVEEVMASRFDRRKYPFVFVHGKFIGGLEETRNYAKEYGFTPCDPSE